MKLLSPTLINSKHQKSKFDCGNAALNIFLQKYALQNSKNYSSRTYVSVCTNNDRVAGYYSLAYGAISHAEATEKVKKKMPQYPIPVIILARLAVDIDYKNMGLGAALLKDAILRTIEASKIAGLRALIVHAKDFEAKNFYLKYGFEESGCDKYHLMLSVQDIEYTLKAHINKSNKTF